MIEPTRWFKPQEMLTTRERLPNTPPFGSPIWDAIRDTMIRMDDIRDIVGPITITSGYRSEAVNAAIGGSKTSAHLTGHACDFVALGMDVRQVCEAIIKGGIKFDQLIDEARRGQAGRQVTWVHISFDPRMRGQVLTQRGGKYLPGLV